MHLPRSATEEAARIRDRLKALGKPCIWRIVALLDSSDDKIMNISSIVASLNSNYARTLRCVEEMKLLELIEEIRIGRLRLLKLKDTPLTNAMINIIRGASSLFGKR